MSSAGVTGAGVNDARRRCRLVDTELQGARRRCRDRRRRAPGARRIPRGRRWTRPRGGSAALRDRRRGRAVGCRRAVDRRSAARHGGAGCRRQGCPRCPALERHPQRGRRPRAERRGRRRGVRRSDGARASRIIHRDEMRWLRDAEPENAARVAAVALPHDWLTWRLAGYGPRDSPLGPDLDALATDRSDASGTGTGRAATEEYDRELLVRALGHDMSSPRVGPERGRLDGRAGRDPRRHRARRRRGRQRRCGPRPRRRGRRCRGLDRDQRHRIRSHRQPAADAIGRRRRLRRRVGRLPAAGRDVERGAGRRRHGRPARRRPRRFGALALAAEPGAGGVVLVPYFSGERTPDLPDATAASRG